MVHSLCSIMRVAVRVRQELKAPAMVIVHHNDVAHRGVLCHVLPPTC